MKPISEELELPIDNWEQIESDKDYNHYDFLYDATTTTEENILRPYVKLETALMSYAFPTEECKISCIIYDYLKDDNQDIIEEYELEPFLINVQSLERTFIDKLFAICDYYMIGKATRNSRHLYDVYKLYPMVVVDDEFRELLKEVRNHRAGMRAEVALAARYDIDVIKIVDELVETNFFARDYEDSTKKLINDNIEYEEVIRLYSKIMHELF